MKNLSILFVLMCTILCNSLLSMEIDAPTTGAQRSKTPTYITAHFADGTYHGIRSFEYQPSLTTISTDRTSTPTAQVITANEDVFSFIVDDVAIGSEQAIFNQLQEFYNRISQSQLDLCFVEKAIMLAQGKVSPSAIVKSESSNAISVRKTPTRPLLAAPEAVLKIGAFEVARNKEFKAQFPQAGNFAVLSGETMHKNQHYVQIALSALRTMLNPHSTAPKRYCIDLRQFQKEFARYKQEAK